MLETWCTGALPCREAGSRATVHVAAPKPFLSGRQDPEPLDIWQPQSPPCLVARSGVVGHVAARGCMLHSLAWLDLKLVYRGTRSVVYRQNLKSTN
jgi:hypothetical protein